MKNINVMKDDSDLFYYNNNTLITDVLLFGIYLSY